MKIYHLPSVVMIFFLIINANSLFAQLINTKLDVNLNYHTGQFKGEQWSDDNGFIYPYFFSNMQNLNGYSGKALYEITPFLSAGIEVGCIKGSDWQLENNNLYNNSEVEIRNIAPAIQFHTKLKETGIFNRLKLFAELSPQFGQAKSKLNKSIFEILNNDQTQIQLIESTDNFYGAKGSAGFEIVLSQAAGMQLAYSMQQNHVTSAFYHDNMFSTSQFTFGLFFRFLKDKRYAY